MNTFAHTVNGRPRPACRVTRSLLNATHGRDSGRELVVSLELGDVICFRPKGTRFRLTVPVMELYDYALRKKARSDFMERKGKEQR